MGAGEMGMNVALNGVEKKKEYVYGNGGVDDVNLYGYVKNNPVNGVDPSGLKAKQMLINGADDTFDFLKSTITKENIDSIGNTLIAGGIYIAGEGLKLCETSVVSYATIDVGIPEVRLIGGCGAGGGAIIVGTATAGAGTIMKMAGGGSGANGGNKYKDTKPGLSGKEGAKDVPSWSKGEKPYTNENGKDFTKRLLENKYGKGNYDTGPNSEFNKIRKWGDRNFQ